MVEQDYMHTVEIGGVKMEVDTRTARRIDAYKIGDRVKVLVKEYSTYKPYPGVIVAFDAFERLPTITVAYLVVSHSGAEVKFAYINGQDEVETEIAPYHDDILVDKGEVIDRLDRERAKLEAQIEDIETKRAYFLRHFDQYFGDFDDLAARVDAADPGA